MQLNNNFEEKVIVHAGSMDWKPSPMKGVDRRMLDRLGDEVARATTIVRYAPNSHFSSHVHTGGEEFLVLEGVFQDEHGDFPAGSYVRNPPESSHTPRSDQGCTIFVKLWQFDPSDRKHININSNQADWQDASDGSGVQTLALYEDELEHVSMERWPANAEIVLDAPDGMEILSVKGSFQENRQTFSAQSWMRLPRGGKTQVTTSNEGAEVWIKRGHLKSAPQAPA